MLPGYLAALTGVVLAIAPRWCLIRPHLIGLLGLA
jgi:hypothetical protein